MNETQYTEIIEKDFSSGVKAISKIEIYHASWFDNVSIIGRFALKEIKKQDTK